MKLVELYGKVRYAVQIEGISRREAARRFGIDPRTVAKMLSFSVPPGYRRRQPPKRPKLDPFVGLIDQVLEEDQGRPAKQRHTAKRIFERLRAEHGYAGGLTIVKDYVLLRRQHQREVFVPLRHDPGHAQVDFGAARQLPSGSCRQIQPRGRARQLLGKPKAQKPTMKSGKVSHDGEAKTSAGCSFIEPYAPRYGLLC